MKWFLPCLAFAGVATLSVEKQQSDKTAKQESAFVSLNAEIEALKIPKVAWREIAWRSCLLDGLKEARAKGKPALLWVFIDRPVNDARC